eukprot:2121451-Alexandrium_andersonii.AAC.1
MRKPEDVNNEEYSFFYQYIFDDWEDHLAMKHFAIEGQFKFRAVIFMPRREPFDSVGSEKKRGNIRLYAR